MDHQLEPATDVRLVHDARSAAAAELGLSTTKLGRPRLPPGFVPRAQVNALLDAGTRRPVTLVSAGAGWGKTLATSAWAAGSPPVGPVAWVSLDRSDNQPRAFWSYVVGALRGTGAVPPDNPLARLVPGLGTESEVVRRLVTGLERLPEPVVLVLDDFHLVDDPAVIAAVTTLVRSPVPQLRLVLLTRTDPMLPLHRLRVAGELGEIRSAELALSVTEAAALLALDGVESQPGDAELLVQRTEGWPAGMRLAALFLSRDAPHHRAADFGGDDHAVVEFLAEEVLRRQQPAMQQFLLRTSVAERLNGSLAEELSGTTNGQQRLEALAASNTFVVALGVGRTWFRYHGLLRQMLRHRLTVETPDLVPELHRRAAHWFSAQGLPMPALRHAAEAEDWALMGRLLVSEALPLALSAERTDLGIVLGRIPEQRLADTPELALAAATRLLLANRFADMRPHLARAEAQLAGADPEHSVATRVGLLLFSVAVARTVGDNAGVMASAGRALDELSTRGGSLPAARGYRATALANLGTGQLWSGRLRAAEATLTNGLAEADGIPEASRVNILGHLALSAAVSGRLNEAEERASRAVRMVEDRGWSPMVQEATAHLALSIVHLQRNDTDAALAALAAGRAAAALEPAPRSALVLYQVRVDAAVGRVDAARGHLARLHRELGDWQPPRLLARWLTVTEAEVDLASGDPDAALERVPLDRPDDHESPLVPERLLRGRALLELSDPHGAEAVLSPLRTAGLEPRSMVEMWVLTALAADRLREDRRADEALHRALVAAEPEGIRRPFVAWGQDHLPRLLTNAKALHPRTRPFVERLENGVTAAPAKPGDLGAQAVSLTDRELSVLQYLPSMMTYPEIADQLFVSVNTVKSHLRHLYAKLEVVNRRQAVTRARDLGLLET